MTPGQLAYQAGHINALYPSLWEWDKESASNQQEYEVMIPDGRKTKSYSRLGT